MPKHLLFAFSPFNLPLPSHARLVWSISLLNSIPIRSCNTLPLRGTRMLMISLNIARAISATGARGPILLHIHRQTSVWFNDLSRRCSLGRLLHGLLVKFSMSMIISRRTCLAEMVAFSLLLLWLLLDFVFRLTAWVQDFVEETVFLLAAFFGVGLVVLIARAAAGVGVFLSCLASGDDSGIVGVGLWVRVWFIVASGGVGALSKVRNNVLKKIENGYSQLQQHQRLPRPLHHDHSASRPSDQNPASSRALASPSDP